MKSQSHRTGTLHLNLEPLSPTCTPRMLIGAGEIISVDEKPVKILRSSPESVAEPVFMRFVNIKGPNRVVRTAAGADYTIGGKMVHLDAFVGNDPGGTVVGIGLVRGLSPSSNGTQVFVHGKDEGPAEAGVGICVSASGLPLTCHDQYRA